MNCSLYILAEGAVIQPNVTSQTQILLYTEKICDNDFPNEMQRAVGNARETEREREEIFVSHLIRKWCKGLAARLITTDCTV